MNNWTMVLSILWYRLYATLPGPAVIGRQLTRFLDDEIVSNVDP